MLNYAEGIKKDKKYRKCAIANDDCSHGMRFPELSISLRWNIYEKEEGDRHKKRNYVPSLA
jgi:hypothetical protein